MRTIELTAEEMLLLSLSIFEQAEDEAYIEQVGHIQDISDTLEDEMWEDSWKDQQVGRW